jgi:hypothetical protein
MTHSEWLEAPDDTQDKNLWKIEEEHYEASLDYDNYIESLFAQRSSDLDP